MRILFSRASGTVSSAEAIVGHRFQCRRKQREDVVVIMGATGTGKSKLSIDVAIKFSGEVVNADKIQVYRGLDITTNKMPLEERRGVPHHLLGELDPAAGELSPGKFRSLAREAVKAIAARRRVPVVAGGSNSYIHAMMVDRYDERESPFVGDFTARNRLRYRSCLLWVDVEAAVLGEHLDRRVDEMVGMGMVEELERYFSGEGVAKERHQGLGKAIGVPELRQFFRRGTEAAYEEAVTAIKANTRRLAAEQVRKIVRLGEMGWPIQRFDATPAVVARLSGGGGGEATTAEWERGVVGPSFCAVERFLREDSERVISTFL